MYILLTGMPPYKGRDNKSIMIEVKEAPFQLTPDKVAGLSDESVDLMAKLLALDPAARIQAADAVQHSWINHHRNYKGESVKIALNNLKHFNNQSRLKEAVQIFLASQIVSHDELKEIRKNFQMLDKDGNGKITKDELMEEYMKVMNFQQASQIVDRIIAQLDQDEDGNIDYTEFLVSCGKNLQKISQDNLTIAFNLFDLDGNGVITSEELRQVLEDGQITDSVVWEELLKEADTNGDGFVDLKEFKKFMKSLSL
jgi:calcium-dependent protein kinase